MDRSDAPISRKNDLVLGSAERGANGNATVRIERGEDGGVGARRAIMLATDPTACRRYEIQVTDQRWNDMIGDVDRFADRSRRVWRR